MRSVPQQVALPIAAEAPAGAVALVAAAAGILVLLVQVAAAALAPTVAVPAQIGQEHQKTHKQHAHHLAFWKLVLILVYTPWGRWVADGSKRLYLLLK